MNFVPPINPAFRGSNASAVIIMKGNSFLLQKRDAKPNVVYGGHWGLFGGALEAGEDFVTAAKREIREEIGLNIVPEYVTELTYKDYFSDTPRNVCRTYFFVEIGDSDAVDIELHEGNDYGFFTAFEIQNLKMAPYDKFIFDLFWASKYG